MKNISLSVESLFSSLSTNNYNNVLLGKKPDNGFLVSSLEKLIELSTSIKNSLMSDFDLSELKDLTESLDEYQKNKTEIVRKINENNFFQYSVTLLAVMKGFEGDYLKEQMFIFDEITKHKTTFEMLTTKISEVFGKLITSKDYRLNSLIEKVINETTGAQLLEFEHTYERYYKDTNTKTELPINELFTNSYSIIEFLTLTNKSRIYINEGFIKTLSNGQDDVIKLAQHLSSQIKTNPLIVNEFNKLNVLMLIQAFVHTSLVIKLCLSELVLGSKNLKKIVELM